MQINYRSLTEYHKRDGSYLDGKNGDLNSVARGKLP